MAQSTFNKHVRRIQDWHAEAPLRGRIPVPCCCSIDFGRIWQHIHCSAGERRMCRVSPSARRAEYAGRDFSGWHVCHVQSSHCHGLKLFFPNRELVVLPGKQRAIPFLSVLFVGFAFGNDLTARVAPYRFCPSLCRGGQASGGREDKLRARTAAKRSIVPPDPMRIQSFTISFDAFAR